VFITCHNRLYVSQIIEQQQNAAILAMVSKFEYQRRLLILIIASKKRLPNELYEMILNEFLVMDC
jgi:hypothetical protein